MESQPRKDARLEPGFPSSCDIIATFIYPEELYGGQEVSHLAFMTRVKPCDQWLYWDIMFLHVFKNNMFYDSLRRDTPNQAYTSIQWKYLAFVAKRTVGEPHPLPACLPELTSPDARKMCSPCDSCGVFSSTKFYCPSPSPSP